MALITATKECEGQVINEFPLRQFLRSTENSTVFLTDRQNGEKAAIKFVPAEAYEATKQLAYWKRASQLSHPHLLKIFEIGRCQLSGRNQVYVAMEYADENLSEILPDRALSAGEAREMLGPLLDALGYLHGNGFVHGRLRPGNIMAANNELKLSSDSIRQAGEECGSAKRRTSYDAPEAASTTLSASIDVWSLGVTLVEVLTQRLPEWETSAGEPVVPASMPEPFREIARNCLKRDPNARWTVPQIKARMSQVRPAPAPQPIPPAQPVATEVKSARSITPLVLAILIVAAIAGATILFRHKADTTAQRGTQLPPKTQQLSEAPAKPSAGEAATNDVAIGNPENGRTTVNQGDVVRQVSPKISPSAQHTIRGKIKLRLRAHVDSAGNVTRAELVSAGPSKYFARLVADAVREWKFVPSTQPGERRYMVHFDLTRRGNSAHAEPTK